MRSVYSILLFPLGVFLSSCSTSHLKNNDQNITLSIDKTQLVANAKTIDSKNFHFPPIYITQQTKKIAHTRYVIYETLKCDTGYMFDESIDTFLYKLYKPQNSKLIKRYENIYFYIATIDNKPINLIVYNQNKKRLNFLYPIPNDGFEKLLNQFSKDRTYKKAPQKSIEATSPNNLSLLKLSARSIVLDGLVKKISAGARR